MSDDLRKLVEDAGDFSGRRYAPSSFKPTHISETRIRFIKGEYGPNKTPFVIVTKHYNPQLKRYQICSSLWQTDPGTGRRVRVRTPESDSAHRCVGCFLETDNHGNTGVPARPIRTSHYFVFTVYVQANFHLDPNKEDGTPLGVNAEGQQKYRRIMCTRTSDCTGCLKGLQVEYGARRRWDLAKKYLNILLDYRDAARNDCANCGAKYDEDTKTGGLAGTTLLCAHCGRVMDVADPATVLQLRTQAVKCKGCGTVMEPKEQLACSACSAPRRPDLYDMDFWVKKVNEKPTSDVVVIRTRVGQPHERIPREQLKPLDLHETMAPEALEEQCQIHEVPNPWVPQMSMYREYGQPPQYGQPAQQYQQPAQQYVQTPGTPTPTGTPPVPPAPSTGKPGDDGL